MPAQLRFELGVTVKMPEARTAVPAAYLVPALNALDEGVVIVDKDGCVVFTNRAYGEILGIDAARVANRRIQEIEPGARILNVIATGQPVLEESVLVKTVGVEVTVSINPILSQGQLIGAVSVFRNVTMVRQLNRAVQAARGYARYLERQLERKGRPADPFRALLGTHDSFRRSLDMAARVAPTAATVMIRGESGTGKELLAQAIHFASPRAGKAFVAVNSAAIPDHLVESELFGYEGGAFTGARKQGKPGKFQVANGGTLFLDEVGDLEPAVQAKLLRVLQSGSVERVGGVTPEHVDVRIIVATHRNLEQMVQQGEFREDLYYRLNVVPIWLLPLRERREDIVLLAESFLREFNRSYGRELGFEDDAVAALRAYGWPGNVRELRHAVEYAVIMTMSDTIRKADLPSAVLGTGPQHSPPLGALERIGSSEKMEIETALKNSGYNKTRAMQALGLSRASFYKKLHKYDLL